MSNIVLYCTLCEVVFQLKCEFSFMTVTSIVAVKIYTLNSWSKTCESTISLLDKRSTYMIVIKAVKGNFK